MTFRIIMFILIGAIIAVDLVTSKKEDPVYVPILKIVRFILLVLEILNITGVFGASGLGVVLSLAVTLTILVQICARRDL